MIISVRATPNSKVPRVIKVDETTLEVKVDARAVGGAANRRLVEILSEYFGVPKSKIVVLKGRASRDKMVSVSPER